MIESLWDHAVDHRGIVTAGTRWASNQGLRVPGRAGKGVCHHTSLSQLCAGAMLRNINIGEVSL